MAKAAVNAAVAQALKDQGLGPLQFEPKITTKAQQQELLSSGKAIPEFQMPGGAVPVPPPGGAANDNASPPAFQRTPKQAALDLKTFLDRTKRFGGGSDRPQEVRDAQRDMGIAPDGIVGPITRKTAAVWSVTLPAATKKVASKAAKSGTKQA